MGASLCSSCFLTLGAQTTMSTTSSGDFYIAKELIFEIISWLPVTSLLRFKSVCKSWFSIISSHAFIKTHLINSKKKQPSSLIWLPKAIISDMDNAVYITTLLTMLNVDEPVSIDLPRNLVGRNNFNCFHSCNGLLFHHNMTYPKTLHANVSFIWNPLTKRLKIVPTTEKQAKETKIYRLGFGFDFGSSDYKILRIVFGYPYYDSVLEAELYSANGDSWKEIQVPDASRSFRLLLRSEFVHANGVLYLEGKEELLAFDLHSEVFKVFSFPNPLHYTRRSLVLDYEGSVAMILRELDGDVSIRTLWTLDDVSWTRKFNLEVDQYLKVWWVHLYLGFGQFVATDYNDEYIIYDHRKKQTKKFPVPLFADKVSLALYSESLGLSRRVWNMKSKVVNNYSTNEDKSRNVVMQ